jgi:hypothetical protein
MAVSVETIGLAWIPTGARQWPPAICEIQIDSS